MKSQQSLLQMFKMYKMAYSSSTAQKWGPAKNVLVALAVLYPCGGEWVVVLQF